MLNNSQMEVYDVYYLIGHDGSYSLNYHTGFIMDEYRIKPVI